jgi:diacylglycerol O-acyltransferase / wax synthase
MLWPDERWPQEIGALAVLDGNGLLDVEGRLQLEVVRRAIESRVHRIPRLRQLLHVPPPWLGGPLWVDAPRFDVADHVLVTQVPAPGDDAALLLVTEQLRRRRLDHSRPLWEMWFLTGLPQRRVGLFVRMHHAIADGIAGVATIGEFLDTTPGAPAGPAPPWTPETPPATRALLADNVRTGAGRLGHALATLTRPRTTARRMRAGWPSVRDLLSAGPTPRTSMDRTCGPDRTFAVIRAGIEEIGRIAHEHGATINDVLLAITAGGLRRLLHSRGEHVEDLTLPVYVPATLRQPEHRELARGNLIGQMVVPLPLGEPDPGRRLARITEATAVEKTRHHPNLGTMLRSRLVRRALRGFLHSHPVNMTTADVPGPRVPVYLAGARVLEVFPILPLVGNVTIGVGALSYATRFAITVVADRDTIPVLDAFTAGAREELRALAATKRAEHKSTGR